MTGPTTLDAKAPVPGLPAATPAQLAKAKKAAQDFESSFLEVMLGQMFEGVGEGPFSGGEGEAAYKSLMTDTMARGVARHGGIGLSKTLTHELLKMQGVSEGAQA